MKTNTSTATNEGQVSQAIRVEFAQETAVCVAVRTAVPLAWVPRKPAVAAYAQRLRPTLMVALLVAVLGGVLVKPAKAVLTNASTDFAVLVVSATAHDAALPAIRQALDFLGTPYTVHIASAQLGALTAEKLFAGPRSFYSSVMLTDSQLAYSPDGTTWVSALSTPEWATLNQYAADFAVRQFNWGGYPTLDAGFNWPTAAFDSTCATPDGLQRLGRGGHAPREQHDDVERDAQEVVRQPAPQCCKEQLSLFNSLTHH